MLPIVSLNICETVFMQWSDDTDYFLRLAQELKTNNPILSRFIVYFGNKIPELYPEINKAELMSLCMLYVYDLLRTQDEVNELEKVNEKIL